jgi:hypothetical protein
MRDPVSADGHCWPTDTQRLLLGAVVLRGPESVDAWQRWNAVADLNTLDAGSIRLLPQLYRRLEQQGVRDPSMSKLKGLYRHTWYGNQLRRRDTARLIAALRERGVDAMLLKGAALTLLHYRDPGLRPMDDVDILVRTHQWHAAVDVLVDQGWRPRVPVTPRHVEATHAMDFVDAQAQRIDLHWHVLPDSCWPGADDEFWKRASTARLHGAEASVLDATDQLFHTCVHGVKWDHVSPVRWIADAAMILDDRTATIDWDRLARTAEEHRLVLPLRNALAYLARIFALPVPAFAVTRLRDAPVSRAERWEYRLRTRPASPVLGRLREHWLRYRRLRRHHADSGVIGFAQYLEVALDCDGIAALARRAVLRHRWRRRAEREIRHRAQVLNRLELP